MAEKQFDNVKINVEFSEEQELKELNSGEGLSVLMGKLAKAVKELIVHIADNVRHITASERANWNGKADGTHGHSAAEISGLPTSLPADGGDANTVGGYMPEELVQNSPNLLRNGNFQLNSSGETSWSITGNGTYRDRLTVDDWKIGVSTIGVTVSAGLTDKMLSVSAGQYLSLYQVFRAETVDYLKTLYPNSVGKIYVSLKVISITGEWCIAQLNGKHSSSEPFTTVGIHNVTFDWCGDADYDYQGLCVLNASPSQSSITIEWIKATPVSAYIPDPMIEALRCTPIDNPKHKILYGDGTWADTPPQPNLLDNPDFKVNQRGKSEYAFVAASEGYSVDRWRILTNTNSTVTIENDGIKLTATDNSTGEYQYCALEQNVENLNLGDTITISIKMRGNGPAIFGQTNGDNAYVVLSNDYKIYSHTIVLNAPTKNQGHGLGINFNNGEYPSAFSDAWVQIKWVKAEYGTVATPFIPPNPALELAKCRRFYQVIDGIYMPATTDSVLGAFWHINLPNRMRVAPSVILPVITDDSDIVGGKSVNSLLIGGWSWGPYCSAVNSNCVQLHLVNTDGSKNENAYKLFANAAPIALSADF